MSQDRRPMSTTSLKLAACDLGMIGLLTFWALAAQRYAEPPSFTASTEPSAVVLYVGLTAPTTGTTRSMTVYGAGRVELRKQRLTRVEESYDVSIAFPERDCLLRLAVEHQLAEWDDASIRARLARSLGTKTIVMSDTPTMRVILALTSYERDGRQHGAFEKEMTFQAVNTASQVAPDVPELVGLGLLVEEMNALWSSAREAREP